MRVAFQKPSRSPDVVFKALGHASRVALVRELSDGERCVCDLVEASGLGWSTVSRHLAVLREAGVVEDDKRGLQVFYRLSLPCVARFIACLDAPHKMPGWLRNGCVCRSTNRNRPGVRANALTKKG